LRASEIGMLQLRNYDPKAAKIFVHRLKGSNSGEHHLMREEAQALRAWLKVRGSFRGPIFLSKQKRPIDRTTLHLLMKKYGAAAGIPEKLRHFHVLKHCCATHLWSSRFRGLITRSTLLLHYARRWVETFRIIVSLPAYQVSLPATGKVHL